MDTIRSYHTCISTEKTCILHYTYIFWPENILSLFLAILLEKARLMVGRVCKDTFVFPFFLKIQ
jgi:hypothetical protein